MKLLMLGQDQFTTRTPSSSAGSFAGRLSCVQYTPRMGTFSSFAHLISQSCPAAFVVFLLTIAIIPSHPFTLARQRVFQLSSQGSLTDMSTNSNGLLSFSSFPVSQSRAPFSSTSHLLSIL